LKDEGRLIRKIQRSGDKASADALVRGYYDEIFRYISRQMYNRADALDITQEVFVSMLGTIRRFDRKKAGFRTWLYRIATNKTIDFFRSSARQTQHALALNDPTLTSDLTTEEETDIETRLFQSDLAERVCRYVDSLPSDVQQVFRLKFFGEHTFAQIAEFMQVPEATVKTRYYRLLQTLRKEFQDECA
jgi:RNA polymerase sigma-70 factor (ECF subfamily)